MSAVTCVCSVVHEANVACTNPAVFFFLERSRKVAYCSTLADISFTVRWKDKTDVNVRHACICWCTNYFQAPPCVKKKKLFLGPAGRLMGVYASFCLCYYRASVLVSAEIYIYIHTFSFHSQSLPRTLASQARSKLNVWYRVYRPLSFYLTHPNKEPEVGLV